MHISDNLKSRDANASKNMKVIRMHHEGREGGGGQTQGCDINRCLWWPHVGPSQRAGLSKYRKRSKTPILFGLWVIHSHRLLGLFINHVITRGVRRGVGQKT